MTPTTTRRRTARDQEDRDDSSRGARRVAHVVDGDAQNRRQEGDPDQDQSRAKPCGPGSGHPPDEPVHDVQGLQQAARGDVDRHYRPEDQGHLGPRTLLIDLRHGAREDPGDPGTVRQVRRVLAQSPGCRAQNREDHVHDRHHEQEEPESERARQDAASHAGVKLLNQEARVHHA
jgi:hypothetical protein